jgi:hypothetical protein
MHIRINRLKQIFPRILWTYGELLIDWNVEMLLNCKKKESEVQLKIRRKVAGSCKSLVYLLKLILFLSYFTVCRQMSIGVFALFGTKSYRSQDILTSYADKFHTFRLIFNCTSDSFFLQFNNISTFQFWQPSWIGGFHTYF